MTRIEKTTARADAALPTPRAPEDVPRAAAVSRRGVLAGAAALAGGPVLLPSQAAGASRHSASLGTAGAVGSAADQPWRHAVGDPRGSDIAVAVGRDREGRFGVMFKRLDAFGPPDNLLTNLAGRMGEPTSTNPRDLDNPRIPAGFTFLGQFIDHDMTLDRTPIPEQNVDPHGLTNFDTPHFDLGSIYGGGPSADPALYEPDGSGRLRVVRNGEGVEDLPRTAGGTARIGDARNDENLIVAQLHLLFLKFHNRCLTSGLARNFAEAQRLTRWHFQWLIVHDYLAHIVGEDVVDRFLVEQGGKPRVRREHYKPKNPNRPMMPIEYSVAAFRFGHSMVRAAYLMNQRNGTVVAPMFGAEGSDLRGSRPLPARLEIDWRHFFDVPGQPTTARTQSRLIDGKLSLPLFNLPPTVVSDPMVSLAQRNLVRGKRLGLPGGQQVAAAMGLTPLSNDDLDLPDPGNAGWAGKAPLWFYILKETELANQGRRLGPVGGRLVAEVILGILDSDRDSYLHARDAFRPAPPIAPSVGQFRMGDFIAFAQRG
nr:putative ovoperoxidase [uncultured bacterium]